MWRWARLSVQQGVLSLVKALDKASLPGPSATDLQRCKAFIDVSDPTFNLPLAFDNWVQVSAKGDLGSLVYTDQINGPTTLTNALILPYYRDDACFDDGTGDDPVPRPWPGTVSTDPRVINGYQDLDGDGTVECHEKQGVYGENGLHFFITADTDNAFVGVPIDQVDVTQWQFMVPTDKPENLGAPYANNVRIPLVPVVIPENRGGALKGMLNNTLLGSLPALQ